MENVSEYLQIANCLRHLVFVCFWIPACAGMTFFSQLLVRLVILVKAGIQVKSLPTLSFFLRNEPQDPF
jgi:hypothetical protein